MATVPPSDILKQIAGGNLQDIITKNDNFIDLTGTIVKLKSKVLREFVKKQQTSGIDNTTLVDILLTLDEALEKNTVKDTLRKYLK